VQEGYEKSDDVISHTAAFTVGKGKVLVGGIARDGFCNCRTWNRRRQNGIPTLILLHLIQMRRSLAENFLFSGSRYFP